MRTYHGVEMGFVDPRCERRLTFPSKPSLPLPLSHSIPLSPSPSLTLDRSLCHTLTVGLSLPLPLSHRVDRCLCPSLSVGPRCSLPPTVRVGQNRCLHPAWMDGMGMDGWKRRKREEHPWPPRKRDGSKRGQRKEREEKREEGKNATTHPTVP